MATKVFYRCIESRTDGWIAGKEYECGASSGMVTSEFGYPLHYREVDEMCSYNSTLNAAYFERIEREDSTTFEAHGHTWFRHTPGDTMPCRGDAWVYTLLSDFTVGALGSRYIANTASWNCTSEYNAIIGWRYANSAKPEVQRAQVDGNPVSNGTLTYYPGTTADLSEYIECAESLGNRPSANKNLSGHAYLVEDESERNDLIAAVDDGHLTPGQKAYIQDKEDAQAAKQQLKHDAEAKALQERADQLADAGKAMDRVNQGHDHRLGWVQ